jgi:hypothetical protein
MSKHLNLPSLDQGQVEHFPNVKDLSKEAQYFSNQVLIVLDDIKEVQKVPISYR